MNMRKIKTTLLAGAMILATAASGNTADINDVLDYVAARVLYTDHCNRTAFRIDGKMTDFVVGKFGQEAVVKRIQAIQDTINRVGVTEFCQKMKPVMEEASRL
jgi:hypothetical protein